MGHERNSCALVFGIRNEDKRHATKKYRQI